MVDVDKCFDSLVHVACSIFCHQGLGHGLPGILDCFRIYGLGNRRHLYDKAVRWQVANGGSTCQSNG